MGLNDVLKSDERKPILSKVVSTDDLEHNGRYFEGDGWNISLLLFLYLLQGIPLGLTAAIPIILQSRQITYSDQAGFSFSSWPFSLKLLWAPIVDAIYSTKFGRRKSWLIPSQILLGSLMLLISANVDNWLGDENGTRSPNVQVLTIMFFLVNFLTATQDVAVDGWAITMLQRKNVGYVSTCTCIGQMLGNFCGSSVFIVLTSAEFTSNYLFWLQTEPKSTGLVSFSTFIFFWAVVILVSTTILGIFKKENTKDEGTSNLDRVSVLHSHKLVWKILKLEPIQYTIIIFLTAEIVPIILTGEVFTLKLVDNGLSRDQIAILEVFNLPLNIVLPIIFRKNVTGPRPLDFYKTVIPYSLVIGLMSAALVYTTPSFKEGTEFPFYYYVLLVLVNGFIQVLSIYLFLGNLAFIARVSDPKYGATYMALLATVANLGELLPSTASLWLVDAFTWKKCAMECKDYIFEPCENIKTCLTFVDGYYVEVVLGIIVGIIWLRFSKRTIDYLQELDHSAWFVEKRNIAEEKGLT